MCWRLTVHFTNKFMNHIKVLWWNFTRGGRRREREGIASGVHMSDNPPSCIWATLSWQGRNDNYGDLQLIPLAAFVTLHDGIFTANTEKLVIIFGVTSQSLPCDSVHLFSVCPPCLMCFACSCRIKLSFTVCLIPSWCWCIMYVFAHCVCVCVCLFLQGGS